MATYIVLLVLLDNVALEPCENVGRPLPFDRRLAAAPCFPLT